MHICVAYIHCYKTEKNLLLLNHAIVLTFHRQLNKLGVHLVRMYFQYIDIIYVTHSYIYIYALNTQIVSINRYYMPSAIGVLSQQCSTKIWAFSLEFYTTTTAQSHFTLHAKSPHNEILIALASMLGVTYTLVQEIEIERKT